MNTYNLSTDYKTLWQLINGGHRIAAWVQPEQEHEIFDIVEVKMRKEQYQIGSRGISYTGMYEGMMDFIKVCKSINLQYVNNSPLDRDEIKMKLEDLITLAEQEDKALQGILLTIKASYGTPDMSELCDHLAQFSFRKAFQ